MNIKFLLDENMPFALIDQIEKRGYSVEHLKKIGKGGIKNGAVYKLAEENKMWIVTRDADLCHIHTVAMAYFSQILCFFTYSDVNSSYQGF